MHTKLSISYIEDLHKVFLIAYGRPESLIVEDSLKYRDQKAQMDQHGFFDSSKDEIKECLLLAAEKNWPEIRHYYAGYGWETVELSDIVSTACKNGWQDLAESVFLEHGQNFSSKNKIGFAEGLRPRSSDNQFPCDKTLSILKTCDNRDLVWLGDALMNSPGFADMTADRVIFMNDKESATRLNEYWAERLLDTLPSDMSDVTDEEKKLWCVIQKTSSVENFCRVLNACFERDRIEFGNKKGSSDHLMFLSMTAKLFNKTPISILKQLSFESSEKRKSIDAMFSGLTPSIQEYLVSLEEMHDCPSVMSYLSAQNLKQELGSSLAKASPHQPKKI